MQHSSAVMGLVPMTPEMWHRNSSTSNTDAMCNLPQFANSLGKCTVLPCYCNGLHVLPWNRALPSLLWSWCHGWVGGASKFFQVSASSKGAASTQSAALKVTLEPPQCVPHARRVVELLCCLRPSVHSPSKPQWGSILLLVRA